MADSQPETMLVSEVRTLLGQVWSTLVVAEDCARALADLQQRRLYRPACSDGMPSRADAVKDHAEIYAFMKRLYPLAIRGAPLSSLDDLPPTVMYPAVMNDAMKFALGLPNFRCGPEAERLRIAGADIPRKAEAEQAAVIHWLLPFAIAGGDDWLDRAMASLAEPEVVRD